MKNDFNKRVLETANDNLKQLHGKKHKPIKFTEIESVYSRNVLGISSDAKTVKGQGKGYLTGIMYLAPAKLSGIEVCPKRSVGCAAACLFTAGRGAFYSITRARVIKTLAYHFDKPRFIDTIKKSIRSLVVKANNLHLTPVVRLNGTSDILWEHNTDIMQVFPDIQFYDYTKIAKRFSFTIPANYHLTFSVSENNHEEAKQVLKRGGNVAMVFRKELPAEYWGYPVINGDETHGDLRFLDAKQSIAGLKAKGRAKRDQSGFVTDYSNTINNDTKAA